jgi:hypothetical protein
MKRADAERLAELVLAAFPQVPLREKTREVYVGWLVDLDAQACEQAVVELIAHSTSMPTVADIRRVVIEEEMQLPDGMQAWISVSERGHELHELAREVATAFGGVWNIRTSEEPDITRAQFLKAYEAAREKRLRAENAQRFQRQYRRKPHAA